MEQLNSVVLFIHFKFMVYSWQHMNPYTDSIYGNFLFLPLNLLLCFQFICMQIFYHPIATTTTSTYICVRVCKEFASPYASCSDCCIVLCWSWSVVVVVIVVECLCCIPYRLALMLVLTFAPSVLTFTPTVLTFAPCPRPKSLAEWS